MPSIKITDNNVTRKIRIEETSSWDDIVRRIADVFSLTAGSLVLTYTDDDDDVITLSTITELQEAMLEGIKKFDVSFSTDRDSSTSEAVTEVITVPAKRERDVDSNDEDTSRSK